MSLAKASSTWVRHNLHWSNSARAWTERGIALAFLAAALALFIARADLSAGWTVALWGALVVALGVALRVGQVSVFGPVLYYDIVRTARQSRYALLRMLYAGLLLLVLFQVYVSSFWNNDNARQAAVFAEQYFELFTLVQLAMVILLTPAYVAGSIAEEKDRQTLEFLLATDLRNREIVLSKLGSRLGNMLLLVLTGLPILSCLQFLGGVDPNLVLMGYAATGLTMLGLGSVSILHSVLLKKPRDAIALTYLFILAYFVLATFLYALASSPLMGERLWFDAPLTYGNLIVPVSEVLNAGNPAVVIYEIGMLGAGGALAAGLPPLLAGYAAFYAGLSLLCLGWSVLRLRAIALKESFGRARQLKDRQRARPPVGELPMIWKELVIEGRLRLNWLSWGVVAVLVLLTLGIGVWIVGYYAWEYLTYPDGVQRWRSVAGDMNMWVRFAGSGVACLTLLWVAVRASTSIGIERDKQTFDALVTSPLTADEMLAAKLIGSIVSVRLGLVWFGAMLGLALLTGGLHVLAVPVVLGAWLVYATCFAQLGLWFSMVSKNALRATVYTVLAALGVGVGHWFIWFCCIPLAMILNFNGGPGSLAEYLWKFQAGQTPPAVFWVLMYSYEDLSHNFSRGEFGEVLAFCIIGVFLWAAAAVAGWFGLLAPQFRKLTRRDDAPDA